MPTSKTRFIYLLLKIQSKNTQNKQHDIKIPLKREHLSGKSESPSETFWGGQQLSIDVAMRSTYRRHDAAEIKNILSLPTIKKYQNIDKAKQIHSESIVLLAIIKTYFDYLDVKTRQTAHSQQKSSPRRRQKIVKINFTSIVLAILRKRNNKI